MSQWNRGGYQQGSFTHQQPNQNYGQNPQMGGHNPQMGGHNPQMGGHNPQMGGYNPQMGGYSQQPGYNQQQGYPPQGYQPQGQRGYPPGGGYPPQPGYGGGARPPPPGIDPVLWGWFQAVDRDNSGSISADELQQALLNNNWSHFNSETCRLMVGMFDKDRSGTIDVYEFAALWKYIQEWKGCFDRFDTDRSGTIDGGELNRAFQAFGYRLSMDFCHLCVRVFDRNSVNSMKFDDFIQCCVMLKSLTDAFKKHDHQFRGVIHINYEQFLEMVLDHQLAGL